MKEKTIVRVLVLLALLLAACRNRGAGYQQSHEDKQAKEMLQGLWTNGESSDPAGEGRQHLLSRFGQHACALLGLSGHALPAGKDAARL